MNKDLKIILAIEFILKDRGGDEIPVWDLIDLIKAIPVCSDVTSEEISKIIEEYFKSGFFEGDPSIPLAMNTLVWKSSTHPSLSKFHDREDIILG